VSDRALFSAYFCGKIVLFNSINGFLCAPRWVYSRIRQPGQEQVEGAVDERSAKKIGGANVG
jgi:hypothetical protein